MPGGARQREFLPVRKEHGAGFWLKLGIPVLSRLPIEWLL
jgi:hypothetical protein